MSNELQTAFNEIADQRALPSDVVLEALQSALVSAYRRDAGASAAQQIEARIDPTTGRARIYVEKEVAEDVFSASTEVTLEKARFYDPEAQIGDTVMVQVEHTTKKFGRIAAQTAKQVILQKIREAERAALYEEFSEKEGDLMTGTVQSRMPNGITLGLGRTEAFLPRQHQIPGEHYRQHEKLRFYVLEVRKTSKGPQIVVSRSHKNMLRRLLEYEVPEIYNNQVEVKSIAREAGHRSKIAVAALQDGIDPVGACVGMRGIRIQNIVKELHDEKIDVIEWNPEPQAFIAKALSPARVTGVYLDEAMRTGKTAVVVVPDEQLSLAIGREGQNARLAAKLTGWRIDIKSVMETVQEGLENIDLPPLNSLKERYAPLIEEGQRVMRKRADNKAVMPEEYNTLGKLADLIENELLEQRKQARAFEMEQIAAVKSTLPEEFFQLPLDFLALPDEIADALMPLGNVGDVMLTMLVDEERVKRLTAKVSDDGVVQVQTALDLFMEMDIDYSELLAEVATDETPEAVEEPDVSAETALAEPETETPEASTDDVEAVAEPAADLVEDADGEEIDESVAELLKELEREAMLELEQEGESEPEAPIDTPEPELEMEVVPEPEAVLEPEFDLFADFDFDKGMYEADKPKQETSSRRRRQLILDEKSGEVVAKRRKASPRHAQKDNEA